MFDIIIIGGGCAGMTAAIYACRSGKTVLLLEAESFGGQIATSPAIENYPAIPHISGAAFASGLFEQATALGAQIELEKVTGITGGDIKTVTTEYGSYQCRAIIIATGVRHRHLGLDREEELIGHGISYCAVCDGAFFKGGTVAVVGGGNTAVQDALYLSEGCKKVYLIHRRDSFRADSAAVELLKKRDNTLFLLDSVITELKGEEHLESVITETRGVRERIDLDGCFIAVGRVPSNQAFAPVVKLDNSGYIIAEEDCITSCLGVFAAGDCRTKQVRQLTTAAADGSVAALGACAYIAGL